MRPTLAAVLILSLASAASAQVVINPRVRINDSLDLSSAAEVVAQILKPDMTDEAKAIACWRFMMDHYYHWFPPYEDSSPEPVRDFAKAINSYGFGPCFSNAPVLTDLWEAAGLKTRSWTITGHSIPEVFYGEAWHMLDADARAFHRKADGQIASVEELASDTKLFTEPPGKSDPYYPFGAPDVASAPLIPWGPPSKMMDLYASRRDNYRYNKRAVAGHAMYVALRPGETLTLSTENVGKWFVFDKLPKDMVWKNPPAAEVKLDKGPVEIAGKHTYGNGTLVWKPDLRKIAEKDLLWLGSENVKLADGKLVAADPGKGPGVAVFRVYCPWVLIEAAGRLDGGGKAKVEVSTDGGCAWATPPPTITVSGVHQEYTFCPIIPTTRTPTTVPEGQMAPNAGRYEYLVRVTFTEPITGIGLENLFQVSPLSLPKLKPGKNTVKVYRGPDEGVVQFVQSGNKAAKERYIVETKGLNLNKALNPANRDEPGHVVYRLTAPDALKAVSIGGNISISRGPIPFVQADYSLDAGATWKQAFRLEKNTNNDNTQFEEDVRIDLAGNQSREVLVKFTISGDNTHAPGKQYGGVESVRLYGYYQLPQPAGAKLALELAWQEKAGDTWADKQRIRVVEKFPDEFELTVGGDGAKLKSITFSPAP